MKGKNIVIVGLFVVVIVMTLGYAALAQQLIINGTANIAASWDIKVTSITEGTMVGAVSKTLPTFSGTGATFNVDLKYPGASAIYTITVLNGGTIDAILQSVAGVTEANTALPTEIKYTISAAANDTLNSGISKTYNVTVNWVSNQTGTTPETIPTGTTSKTATIYLNYIQAY